jgi:hypothetical protein
MAGITGLIRRNRASGELAYYRCWSEQTVALHHLNRVGERDPAGGGQAAVGHHGAEE